jgi:hypothetical protein
VLSGRSNVMRRKLLRRSLASSPVLSDPRLRMAVKTVFLVGSACTIPTAERAQPICSGRGARCGQHACERRQHDGKEGQQYSTMLGEADVVEELSLEAEQRQHGDLVRLQTVDEYSRSAEKVREFVLRLPQLGHSFQYLVKLDDDSMIDVARLLCGLAKFSNADEVKSACQRMLLMTTDAELFEGARFYQPQGMHTEPSMQPFGHSGENFWWSCFHQHSIQSMDPSGAYYVSPATGARVGAARKCLSDPIPTSDSLVSTLQIREWSIEPLPEPGTMYQVYGFGGSHLLTAGVVRWWSSHPEALTTADEDVWMEDVAIGLWFAEYVRAHDSVPTFLVHDVRWLESPYRACVQGAMGINMPRSGQDIAALKHMASEWTANLAKCGNGCGCTSWRMGEAWGGQLGQSPLMQQLYREEHKDKQRDAAPPLIVPTPHIADARICYGFNG